MIQRLGDKQKPCTYCTQYGHTAWSCPRKPRATMNRGTSTLKTTKPMNRRGKVAKEWAKTRSTFMKTVDATRLTCHYCRKALHVTEVEVDHKESRTRRPDLRHELSNLVVSCHFCNSDKGSKSHEEYCKVC